MTELTNLLAQVAWKSTLILAAGFAAAWLPTRVSAAFRHFAWTLMFGALLLLPATIALAPAWSLPAGPAALTAATTITMHVTASAPRPVPAKPTTDPLPWIYLAGAVAIAIRFLAGAVRTHRLLAGARPVARHGLPNSVRVLASETAPVPLAWGVFRPVIVLPSAHRSWPGDRLRAVLLHEFIHVRRRDLLAQILTQAVCCLYWFHPLAWIASREQRRQRERACDDAVLRQGIAPADYAGHLVDLVRGLTVEAPAMAEANDFEGRVRDLLDRGRNRAPVGRGLAFAASLLAAILILPVATLTSHAQSGNGAIAGIVTDPSGSRVPNVSITAKNLDGTNVETTTANPAGEYAFRAIPAGRYEIQVRAPGFKLTRYEATVTAGNATAAPISLELGEVNEIVKVRGARGPSPAAAPARAPQRIPVGGNVQPVRLLHKVDAVYPEQLQRQGVTGQVYIRAIIGKNGEILSPKVLNTDIHPDLAKAALDAVKQWTYSPTLLNGQPVETLTTVTISFELDK